MIEVTGNLWSYDAGLKPWDIARVITTNGTVKNNGEAVMGRGCAREAADMWPRLPEYLGQRLARFGNHVFDLGTWGQVDYLLSMPVKHHWREQASLTLICQSRNELETVATAIGVECVVLPRPGCGNGGLEWDGDYGVRQHLSVLDDRFHVITYGREDGAS